MSSKILHIFTRTPLHVGAGASIGAIDQPIQRERHTGFPIIPASSLKGTFADAWNEQLLSEDSDKDKGEKRVRVLKSGEVSDPAWLFGSDSDKHAGAGALQFSEARVLAFPIRSAKGSFAWITCPLMLQRAARDGVIDRQLLEGLKEPKDEQAVFNTGGGSKLALGEQIVLEEYTFTGSDVSWLGFAKLAETLANLLPEDPVWAEVKDRLVILSDGMMSFFARNACEIAQHVRINDETGTAEPGALFNQENVPTETYFYSIVRAFEERVGKKPKAERRKPAKALEVFGAKVAEQEVFQFGGDASTGLGYCTVKIH